MDVLEEALLGEILDIMSKRGAKIDHIGIINTPRPLDNNIYDKKEVTSDSYHLLILAPVYDERGIPIEGVKDAYGICTPDTISRAQSQFSLETLFPPQQLQKSIPKKS